MQSLLILGRQPALGLAELESLYGPKNIKSISQEAVLVEIDPSILAFKRLGGSLKLAKPISTLDSTEWRDIEKFLIQYGLEYSNNTSKGKITLGLSLYGFNLGVRSISASSLKIKRALQKTGRSVRLVPNKDEGLNTAQVIHNRLTSNRALEILIIKSSNKTFIAQTVMVQDIEAYSKRDQARPNRDSRVGMLPPKLAQIIINLASGQLTDEDEKSIDQVAAPIHTSSKTVLDPFCGSGVVLQEATLMGYDVIGSDLNPRMVEYTKRNLSWLADQYKFNINTKEINIGDARDKHWPNFDFVATETNLGKPLSALPSNDDLNDMISQLNSLIEQFLKNIASQTSTGIRLCLAIPAWQIKKDEFQTLPLIDHLPRLGYNLIDFEHARSNELIYYRPSQLVARKLLTITRN